MNKKKNTATVPDGSTSGNNPVINRKARQIAKHYARKKKRKLATVPDGSPSGDVKVVYHDDSYIDKTKKVFKKGMQAVKERVAKKNAKHDLPERIITERRPMRTTCLIINREAKERAFLPDKKPQYKILVHGSVIRDMVSRCCMLLRITANRTKDTDEYLDGSWAITPAEYRMLSHTTIQHVRRRPWFFLRRYWYEISFDGRVQPAHLLFDYELNPEQKRTRLWITREYVPIAKTDRFNDYFRFWRFKPKKTTVSDGSPSETKGE